MPCRPKVPLPIAPQKMRRRTRTKPRQQSQASRPPDRIVMSTSIGGVRATRKVNSGLDDSVFGVGRVCRQLRRNDERTKPFIQDSAGPSFTLDSN